MISVSICNSVNDDVFSVQIATPCNGATFVSPDIHRYISDFLYIHFDRDVRFYLDFHRNYVEEDIFKGF